MRILATLSVAADITHPGIVSAKGMQQLGCLPGLILLVIILVSVYTTMVKYCNDCREMSQVVALVHKVKGTFRRSDPCVKYMDKIVSTAELHAAETQPASVELDDDVDLDFFDRQDLGVLNRRLRKASPLLPSCCAMYVNMHALICQAFGGTL